MLPDQFRSLSLPFLFHLPGLHSSSLADLRAAGLRSRPSADPRENPDGRILHFWRKACALIGQSCLWAACLASGRTGQGRKQKDVASIKGRIKKRAEEKRRHAAASAWRGGGHAMLTICLCCLKRPGSVCCSRRCTSVCRNRTISQTNRGNEVKHMPISRLHSHAIG